MADVKDVAGLLREVDDRVAKWQKMFGPDAALGENLALAVDLRDTLRATVREMNSRELHHFEVEAENANLREVPQKVYNALHLESRERALEILHRALNP